MTIHSDIGARTTLRALLSRRMLVAFLMGLYSGLPLLLTGSVLQAWMKEEGVNLATIGAFALVGLPYTVKFAWAPLFDRFTLPLLGRRRGWLAAFQVLLSIAIAAFGLGNPAATLGYIAAGAIVVAFFSASQDIVADAYRRETLSDDEQGLGAALFVNGYRLGMLLASGGGLILADVIGFKQMYWLMATVMLTGAVMTAAIAKEPQPPNDTPSTLADAVVQPFVEFFGRPDALWILLFILLYKLGDTVAGQMTTLFYLDMGYSKTEIGAVVKLFGFWATVAGGLMGGFWILRTGIYPALWQFGLLQALSTAAFALLAQLGASLVGLSLVISFENLSAGMGTAAFTAFMASQTDTRFTATQYALLSSLIGIPRVLISAPSGWLAEEMGWLTFFIACSLMAIPGLIVLIRFRGWVGSAAPAH
jgi:PAT family beta-lactamase induction signal transducer AmpG